MISKPIKDQEQRITAIIEAFAVGDATGMPTEFMTRREICEQEGFVSRLLESSCSKNHGDLATGSITDDTEQNLYLIQAYRELHRIDCLGTARALLAWIHETDAVAKKYIGPSSLRALQAIENGADPRLTGKTGTTCGGIMRSLSATLCTAHGQDLLKNINECMMPTHHTSQALEAACAYAYALQCAMEGNSIDLIIKRAVEGAESGLSLADYPACAASSGKRILHMVRIVQETPSEQDLLDYLYDVIGTGLESADVCTAVFAIFLYAREDVWLAIRMGASVGGDTDTIAALAGALCCAYAGKHNIPDHILKTVLRVNNLDISKIVAQVQIARGFL